MLSNLYKDLHRNRVDYIIFLNLFTYRFGNYIYYHVNVPVVRQILWFIYRIMLFFFHYVLSGGELHAECHVGGGLRLPHGLNGIIIHKKAELGNNVTMFPQVTIGANEPDFVNDVPKIGNNVFIGAGAKIFGSIFVGDNSRIGANAVVFFDVPPNATVVGNPARIINIK